MGLKGLGEEYGDSGRRVGVVASFKQGCCDPGCSFWGPLGGWLSFPVLRHGDRDRSRAVKLEEAMDSRSVWGKNQESAWIEAVRGGEMSRTILGGGGASACDEPGDRVGAEFPGCMLTRISRTHCSL